MLNGNGNGADAIVEINKIKDRLAHNPNERVMFLYPAKKPLGGAIGSSKRLHFVDRWNGVGVPGDVGVVLATNLVGVGDRNRIKDACLQAGKIYLNVDNGVGLGRMKKELAPFMEGWRPQKVATKEPVPAPQPPPRVQVTPAPVAAPAATKALSKIPVSADGKVARGELLALVAMELETYGSFDWKENHLGFKAAIDRLVKEAEAQGFGERTTRASIINAYDRGKQKRRDEMVAAVAASTPAVPTPPAVKVVQGPIVTSPAHAPTKVAEEVSAETIDSLLGKGIDDFHTARTLFDEAGRQLNATFTQVRELARNVGRAELRGEARRQLDGLHRQLAERDKAVARLEAANEEFEARNVGLNRAVEQLERDLTEAREKLARTDQSAKIAELEGQLAVYRGIEQSVPHLRTMRENAEAINRSLAAAPVPHSK